jgi:hypothetical protein
VVPEATISEFRRCRNIGLLKSTSWYAWRVGSLGKYVGGHLNVSARVLKEVRSVKKMGANTSERIIMRSRYDVNGFSRIRAISLLNAVFIPFS